ncbi:hypothetical protein BKA82DRAFT_4179466, partial [Pisolithus tinctorius]
MIGSLVIVFPTPHEGGELVLRKNDHERVVDFAKIDPCVGYVSFFSDVEHEARVVTSCHRTDAPSSYPVRHHHCTTRHWQEAVYKLMTNNQQSWSRTSGYRCHRFPQLSEKPRCCTWLCFICFWRVLERPTCTTASLASRNGGRCRRTA